jgi:CRP/FNR family transcriptional regulator, anaerobic regulatory protein
MIPQEQFKKILQVLPILKQAEPALVQEFQRSAFYVPIPAGRDVFVEGDYPESIALIISGIVRVYKVGQTGREITLYRFGLGQSCILTANAILNQKTFPAIATVEEDIEAVMIPADLFKDWVKRYDIWREFVFDLLSDRLATIMTTVDEILFQRLDQRVASWLLQKAKIQNPAQVTHQEIAADLGSSREVISRILEEFRHSGYIESGRGLIEILDEEGLKTCAGV